MKQQDFSRLEDTREPPDYPEAPEDDEEWICPECHGEGMIHLYRLGWVLCDCNRPRRRTPKNEVTE